MSASPTTRLAFRSPGHAFGIDAGQHLQRDVAVQPRVVGAIDLTHAAGTERAGDFVDTETHARGQTH